MQGVDGTGSTDTGALFSQIAGVCGRAAFDAVGDEHVRWTRSGDSITCFRHIAISSATSAHVTIRAVDVHGTGTVAARARLGYVTQVNGRATHRTARDEKVRRTDGIRARAIFRDIADAGGVSASARVGVQHVHWTNLCGAVTRFR